MPLTTAASGADEVPAFAWGRLVRAHIRDLESPLARIPRALVVGTAGSGKTFTLHHLSERMRARGEDVAFGRPTDDLHAVPPTSVLFIDDAHRLDERQLSAIETRVADDAASTILACRPWPRSDRLRLIARRLEYGHPPIVLGQVSARELRAHLDSVGTPLLDACVSSLVDMCGSVTWLIREALLAHGAEPCVDPEHGFVRAALSEVIAERLRTVELAIADHVERESLGARRLAETDSDTAVTAAAFAEGLLLRDGRPAPIVRDAVLTSAPLTRLAELAAAQPLRLPDAVVERLNGVDDPRVAEGMLRLGDAALVRDPARAAAYYRSAEASGADPQSVAVRLAQTAWARGHVDRAGALIDDAAVPPGHAAAAAAADIRGAVWAARGLMSTSVGAYAHLPAGDAVIGFHARIAALAAGVPRSANDRAPVPDQPASAHLVALHLLDRGLRRTLDPPPPGLDDLVRASAAYTEASARGPIPELPAVIAALTALNLGELDVAHSTLLDALRGGHGGAWARPRLLLWTAWVALHRQRPEEAALRLKNVHSIPGTLTARDTLLRDAVTVAQARRYGDADALRAVWRHVRDDLRQVEPDLFSLYPVAEFVAASAFLDDGDRFDDAFAAALALTDRLGDPAIWATGLHWTGLHIGMRRGRPQEVRLHARALASHAATHRVAAAMSQAVPVWLALHGEPGSGRSGAHRGSVSVATAVAGLADVGRAWDAAQLAALAAARTSDPSASARFSDLARQMHPRRDPSKKGSPAEPGGQSTGPLSAREREVAALVISGKTYVEIGETIFISPRTAEHHIARIRRRLGATSRADLIAKLRTIVEGSPPDEKPEDTSPDDPTRA